MASLTKLQVRTLIQQLIDDPNAANWSAANLDTLVSMVYDELWSMILNVSPFYVSQKDTILNLTSPGYLDSRLVADGGALSQRFHRLHAIVRGEQTLQRADPRDVIVQNNIVIWAPSNNYVFYGDQIWIFPLDLTTDVEIRYSFKPAKFTTLADGAAISWPDGYESALVFESAGRAMLKGDRESGANLLAIAMGSRQEMLSTIKNRSHFMSVPWANQDPVEFGGI